MAKAKFVRAYQDRNPFNRHAWEHTILVYEYRGYEYMVEKANNGSIDNLKWQHEEEQKRIDEKIAHKDDPIPEWKYEGSAQEGFDLFWDYVEGKEG